MGRRRKYKSGRELRRAIDAYLASISYQTPAVVSTPTGEVDEEGRIKYATRLLTEAPDGTGRPRTVTQWLESPSVPGLLLWLGISKATWSEYRGSEDLGRAVEYWDMQYEAYLAGRLESGKHVSGVMFNLEHNFGWGRTRPEEEADGRGGVIVLAPVLPGTEEQREGGGDGE